VSSTKVIRLRVLRAERGLTQLAVARRLGVSQSKYWQIENGYTTPTDKEAERLARILKVSEAELELRSA
jgi:transcriptional regulator with XRE-family HTH domain